MAWEDRDYHREEQESALLGRTAFWSLTKWLIVVNVVVFVVDALTGRVMGPRHGVGSGFLTQWGHFSADTAIFHFQVWRFLTFQFLHAGILHLVFNMFALYWFGPMVESHLGGARYLAFYLISGLGGAIFYLVLWGLGTLAHDQRIPFLLLERADTPLVGASAGIFGILVAAAVMAPHMRVNLIFPPISLTMRTLALVFIGIAVFVVMVGDQNAGGQAAHLGGALTGYILIKMPYLLGVANLVPGSAMRRMFNTRRRSRWERKEQSARRAEEKLEAEVDRILAKVKEHGLQSLTSAEKRTLQKATQRQRLGE